MRDYLACKTGDVGHCKTGGKMIKIARSIDSIAEKTTCYT